MMKKEITDTLINTIAFVVCVLASTKITNRLFTERDITYYIIFLAILIALSACAGGIIYLTKKTFRKLKL